MSRSGLDRRDLVAIACGGMVGAALRWWITDVDEATDGGWFRYAPNTIVEVDGPAFPWTTLAVNLIGTLVLGFIVAWRAAHPAHRRLQLTLAAGFCGSLTTFSTFATDIAHRLRPPFGTAAVTIGTDLSGFEPGDVEWIPSAGLGQHALAYLVLSVLGGAAAFAAGRGAARRAGTREHR